MKKITIILFTIFFFPGLLFPEENVTSSYTDDVEFTYSGNINPGKWLKKLEVEYEYNGKKYSVFTQIYFPKKYKKGESLRTIVALHGFEANYLSWGRKTNIETFADRYNFAIACPNTGKTLFESNFYPETKYKWSGVPGARFVGDILIKFLRSRFALAPSRGKTGILGASTGGRGAVIVASIYRDLFSAVCGLSGLYDKVSMPKYTLISDIYGDYKKFTSRWENDDNAIKLAGNLGGTSVYLFHGGADYTFSNKQSLILAIRLNQVKKKSGGNHEIIYRKKKYKKHDWSSWNYALEDVMEFFDRNLSKD